MFEDDAERTELRWCDGGDRERRGDVFPRVCARVRIMDLDGR